MIDFVSKKRTETSKSEGTIIGPIFNSRYEVKDMIGQGASGSVFLVYDSIDKEEYLLI